MQRVIIFLIAIPLLFACSTNNTKSDNNKTDDQPKVVTNVEDGAATISYAKEDMVVDSTRNETTSDKPKSISGLVSKTGKAEAERGTIEDEDEALNLRRARTQFTNGTTYYKEGELDKAIESFKNSLEFKPDNDKAFYNLGKIYYDQGQKELSLSYYKDAVRINPGDSLSLVAIGLLYYEKGNMEEALRYYNQTVDIAPKFGMVYFNRGTMFGQNKNYDQSLEDLTKAIQYDSENSEAYINRGLAYFYTKNIELACKDWKKAESMGNPKGKQAVEIYCSGKKKK